MEEKKQINCPICGYLFTPRNFIQKYCCKMCSTKAQIDKNKGKVKGMRRRVSSR